MIEVDDEVWAELVKRGEPLVDKANDVLRREFGLNGHRSASLVSLPASTTRPSSIGSAGSRQPRLPRGERTPEEDYFIPILEAVDELGGRARVQQILDRVGSKMEGRLRVADFELLSTGAIRWRNAAEFARNAMVKKKNPPLLNPSAPHGWWEITEAGRQYLKSNSK